MLKYAGVYLATFVVLFLIDMLWLRVIAVQWYQQAMGPLLTDSPNLIAAALFYLMFPLGLVIFAVAPGEASASVLKVAGMGALFGFFAYATYDLTNIAVVRNWPVGISILDMGWGAFASAVASAAGKFTIDWLK
jgi:uncharacterized membrane protein